MGTKDQTVKDHAQILWEASAEDFKDYRRQKAFIEFCRQANLIYFAAERYAEAARNRPDIATLLEGYKKEVLKTAIEMFAVPRERKMPLAFLKRFKTPFIIMIGLLFLSMAMTLVIKLREASVHLQNMGNGP